MNKPHYGLAYPPKPFRWRRWLAVLAFFLAAYWQFGRYTFEIVEIDDGSAPGNGPYILTRYINGDRIDVKVFLPAAENGGQGLILLDAHRGFATEIGYATDRTAARTQGLRLAGDFHFFLRQCTYVIRWRDGVPTPEGCRNHENERLYP
jgi:hypothetical protein